MNDRKCANGHWWRWIDGKAVEVPGAPCVVEPQAKKTTTEERKAATITAEQIANVIEQSWQIHEASYQPGENGRIGEYSKFINQSIAEACEENNVKEPFACFLIDALGVGWGSLEDDAWAKWILHDGAGPYEDEDEPTDEQQNEIAKGD